MKRPILLLSLAALVSACTDPAVADGGVPEEQTDGGHPPQADAGGPPPADAGAPVIREEEEPNDISAGDEANALAVGEIMRGTISTADDVDAFHVDTVGGRAYRVHLELRAGSTLDGHLTVLDDGRGDSPAGGDYVQLSESGVEAHVNLELVAMDGGHYVIVRDKRALGGGEGSGSDEHTYELWVEELDVDAYARPALSFPSTVSGALAHAGGIHIYPFEAGLYEDVIFDLEASGDMDGRLFVVSRSSGDWIARNDDRAGSVDPLIDAPMTEGGALLLVVDNVAPDATSFDYSMSVEKP